jgi:hypothetical protein
VSAVRALLGGIVDYAGLFPPAALDLPTAVRNYASYLEDADAWMLGRFVIPVARLTELDEAGLPRAPAQPWRLTALVGGDIEADLARVADFNASHRGRASVEVLEAKASSVDEIRRLAAAAERDRTVFVELPVAADLESLLGAVKEAGFSAKIRTGGVVADAFPTAQYVARFIRACLSAHVPFKATAGLHHPLRAEYRLTYEPGAPRGLMFGYLNVFLAAALIANGLSDADAVRLLEERDPSAFDLTPVTVGWRGHVLTADEVTRVREHVAVSFGSCSYREPVDELRALSLAAI